MSLSVDGNGYPKGWGHALHPRLHLEICPLDPVPILVVGPHSLFLVGIQIPTNIYGFMKINLKKEKKRKIIYKNILNLNKVFINIHNPL